MHAPHAWRAVAHLPSRTAAAAPYAAPQACLLDQCHAKPAGTKQCAGVPGPCVAADASKVSGPACDHTVPRPINRCGYRDRRRAPDVAAAVHVDCPRGGCGGLHVGTRARARGAAHAPAREARGNVGGAPDEVGE